LLLVFARLFCVKIMVRLFFFLRLLSFFLVPLSFSCVPLSFFPVLLFLFSDTLSFFPGLSVFFLVLALFFLGLSLNSPKLLFLLLQGIVATIITLIIHQKYNLSTLDLSILFLKADHEDFFIVIGDLLIINLLSPFSGRGIKCNQVSFL